MGLEHIAIYVKNLERAKEFYVNYFGAMLLVAGSGNSGVEEARGCIWGDILVLLAQFSYAFYIVCYKDLVGKYSPITIMKWMFTYSFLFTAPFSYGQFASARPLRECITTYSRLW